VSAEVFCVLCGKPIENVRSSYQRVRGFEKHRQSGGTNALRLREPLQEFAHSWCVDRAANGLGPTQESLL